MRKETTIHPEKAESRSPPIPCERIILSCPTYPENQPVQTPFSIRPPRYFSPPAALQYLKCRYPSTDPHFTQIVHVSLSGKPTIPWSSWHSHYIEKDRWGPPSPSRETERGWTATLRNAPGYLWTEGSPALVPLRQMYISESKLNLMENLYCSWPGRSRTDFVSYGYGFQLDVTQGN